MTDKTVAIIGAGQVGSTIAYTLYNRDLCDIILINHNRCKAISNVLDILDCSIDEHIHNIRYGTYEDIDDVDIIINCAGNSSMLRTRDRNSELDNSIRIANDIISKVNNTKFKGIFINIMNPCDDVTFIFRELNIPIEKIIGTGTLLETIRFRRIVYDRYNINTKSYVIGNHGEYNDVIVVDNMDVLTDKCVCDIMKDVRNRVWRIYEGKGFTNFGITNISLYLLCSILNDVKDVICISTLCTQSYNIYDKCVSIPCIIGRNGVEKVIINKTISDTLDKLKGE